SGSLVWPGLAPAGECLSLSRQRKSPKKGEPKSGALRASLRCSRRGENSQTCPLRGLRTCEFLIPTPLRCSARPHGKSRDRDRAPPLRAVPSLPPPLGEAWPALSLSKGVGALPGTDRASRGMIAPHDHREKVRHAQARAGPCQEKARRSVCAAPRPRAPARPGTCQIGFRLRTQAAA